MKQVILVRSDLEMSKGKSMAQASHVSVLATREAVEERVGRWLNEGGKKIILKVESAEQLNDVLSQVDDLPTAKIEDLGYTELEPGTLTAGAIGPAEEEEIDRYTSDLPLFS